MTPRASSELTRVVDEIAALRKDVADFRTAIEGRLSVAEQRSTGALADLGKLERRVEDVDKRVNSLEETRAQARGAANTVRAAWALAGALFTAAAWLISTLLHR